MRVDRHPLVRKLGFTLGRLGRRVFGSVLDLFMPVPANRDLASLGEVRRMLLVRPNFRIGNTLMATPLVPALLERFPDATLDVLTGDATADLLAGLPIRRVHCVSRQHILAPWRFVALFLRLRREAYDVAVEGGLGSFSGGLYAYLTGARFRLGQSGKADRFLNVRVATPPATHAYDATARFAESLGATCPHRPIYRVTPEDAARARDVLRNVGLVREGRAVPFVALCAGGHQSKRWSAERWVEVATRLDQSGVRPVVFLGPEERQLEGRLRRELPAAAHVLPPYPLGVFAGLLDEAGVVITPDSGPMHIAAALGKPTIALLQSESSRFYAPRGEDDRALLRADVEDVVAAVLSQPAWRELADVTRSREAPLATT